MHSIPVSGVPSVGLLQSRPARHAGRFEQLSEKKYEKERHMAQVIASQRGPVTATAKSKSRRPFLLDLYSTAVGKKYVMADAICS